MHYIKNYAPRDTYMWGHEYFYAVKNSIPIIYESKQILSRFQIRT